jgi:hypothetical protein
VKFLLRPALTILFFAVFACESIAQINTPLRVKDENEPQETKQVLVDFQHYVVRAISYPSKANKNSIQKTLYYTIKVNDNNTVSDFQRIDSIPESEEESVFPFYFTAPSYGTKGKEDSSYDKDFVNMVEKTAKKFNRYKTGAQVNSETVYMSFNFTVK